MEQLNRVLFLAINATDPASYIAVAIAQFAAQWLVFLPIAIIAGLWTWGAPRGRGALLAAGLALVIGMTTNQLISARWFHPRPFMAGSLVISLSAAGLAGSVRPVVGRRLLPRAEAFYELLLERLRLPPALFPRRSD
jgi:hypothetical protein